MESLIEECMKQKVWAVVGFSENRRKYGHLIYFDLKKAGYIVFPVNRKGGSVDDARIYRSVKDLPVRPGVVDVVVQPEEALGVARDCVEAGIERIWFQPGAESEDAIEFCQAHGLKVVYNACAMIEKHLF